MKLEFFPAAEQELTEAADQYERRLLGLGHDFVLEVERVAAVLMEVGSRRETRSDSPESSITPISLRTYFSS